MASVLVIEDNVANRKLMAYLLQAFGHMAIEAATGEEGLEITADTLPDLVLLDLQLPGLDGFQTLAELRTRPGATMPVVAVTAYAMVGDEERVRRAGFDGFITKPIEPQHFISRIEQFLPRHLAHAPALVPRDTAPGDATASIDCMERQQDHARRDS